MWVVKKIVKRKSNASESSIVKWNSIALHTRISNGKNAVNGRKREMKHDIKNGMDEMKSSYI